MHKLELGRDTLLYDALMAGGNLLKDWRSSVIRKRKDAAVKEAKARAKKEAAAARAREKAMVENKPKIKPSPKGKAKAKAGAKQKANTNVKKQDEKGAATKSGAGKNENKNTKSPSGPIPLAAPERPPPNVRIVCLSDGCDVGSVAKASKVAEFFQKEEIVMDLLTIGDDSDVNAHGIAVASGGFSFQPKTLRDALQLNELEPLLFSHTREEGFRLKRRANSGKAMIKNDKDFETYANKNR